MVDETDVSATVTKKRLSISPPKTHSSNEESPSQKTRPFLKQRTHTECLICASVDALFFYLYCTVQIPALLNRDL